MNIDEAIKHCYEVASLTSCTECKKDHEQLAEWLKELKSYREKYGTNAK